MCLAVPMQVVSCDGLVARCEARGVTREISLFLLQDELIRPGDHVLVHAGSAIEKVTEDRAHSAWALLDELLAAEHDRAKRA